MCDGEHSFTKTGRQRRAGYAQVADWIVAAWKNVKESSIVNGFRKSEMLPTETTLPEFDDDDSDGD